MQVTLKGDMNILIPMVKASGLYYTHMFHFGWTPSEHHLSGLWKYSRGLHQQIHYNLPLFLFSCT